MLSEKHHAIIWLDHHEARVVHLSGEKAAVAIHPAHPPRHLHEKAGSASGTHVGDEPEFYQHIVTELAGVDRILVAGPASAKTEFIKYLGKHAHDMSKRVAGIETLERLTDPELVVEAHKFFLANDRMQPEA
jgi:hypothetical protein